MQRYWRQWRLGSAPTHTMVGAPEPCENPPRIAAPTPHPADICDRQPAGNTAHAETTSLISKPVWLA
ncbi:unnamed protein product, partial [Iphiclides podalirius]